jgi:hypothetical protein
MGLWQIRVDSWIMRNNELYGKTEEEKFENLRTVVNNKIQNRCINDQQRVLEVNKSLFFLPIEV